MSWVKLDDGFYDHRKVVAAGPMGVALWVVGLAYCNRQPQRDGFIPAAKVACLYPIPRALRVAATLVEVGLWEQVEGGFQIHDYHDYQPSAERSRALAEKRAEAGRIGGKRSGEARAKQIASPLLDDAKQTDEAKTNPVPVPVPVPKEEPPYSPPAARRGRAVEVEYSDPFKAFWSAYPRREGKGVAWEKWRRLGCDALLDPILAAVERQRATEQWVRDGGKFIPHPATWLHGRRWEDEGIAVNASGMTPDEQRRFDEALAGGRRLHA